MAKYTFANMTPKVLPKVGEFCTNSGGAIVCYDVSHDDVVVELRICDQICDQEDLEDLIEFLESLKEHLKGG